MARRYLVLWFTGLTTDWQVLRRPALKELPFVFALPDHGRLVVTAVSLAARARGVEAGMRLADAKAMIPDLEVLDEKPGRAQKLLRGIGQWCIRYSPIVAVHGQDCLVLDISGCTHLWGGEKAYLKDLARRLKDKGYTVRGAIADTIGAAWANARYGKVAPIIECDKHTEALMPLPPAALRLEPDTLERLHKLGFRQISMLLDIPRSNLRRRFGEGFLRRLAQALGWTEEYLQPLAAPEPFQERLPCLEPVTSRPGIERALNGLLEALCKRLAAEGKGLRNAALKCFRVDGKVQVIEVGTNGASHHAQHLFKLFELRIAEIAPGLGIELFVLEASGVEESQPGQEALWRERSGLDEHSVLEFIDRVAGKVGAHCINRYLPEARYWPERSLRPARAMDEKAHSPWRTAAPRPTQLLPRPQRVEVSAPIPDYPPMLFRYQGQVHHIKKADGPERIEREWWLEEGDHRDYYVVEDQEGQRYWLFRLGHYKPGQSRWYLHGFFA